MAPDGVRCGEGLGEGSGAEVLGALGDRGARLKTDAGQSDGEENEDERHAEIREDDGVGLEFAVAWSLTAERVWMRSG